MRNVKYAVLGVFFAMFGLGYSADVRPGDDLQAVLDTGEDLVLKKGCVYEISNTLHFKKPGQKIYTKGAQFPSDYANLKLVNKEEVTLVNAFNVERAVLEHVICDGNRYELSVRPFPETGKVHQPGVVNFGGAEGQVVRECVFMNARGFSNVVLHKGAGNQLVENNLILGAGADARGNGREMNETPFRWADGISCAARDSVIRNNLIIDSTDVGIVLYGAPGTVVENNVIASVSRESLGGVNLVDGLDYYALNEDKTLFDYRGSTVRNNYIEAFGSRVHVGIPVGSVIWASSWEGKILTGGKVSGNTIAGEAGAYGLVAHGITHWKITGNKSTATYSGLIEYGDPVNPPDDPAPFLYDVASVKESQLQPEFVKSQRHLKHLLRTHRAPENELGYRMHDYGEPEVRAVVKAAYLEMLGREPSEKELAEGVNLLCSKKLNADGLRRELMDSAEFKKNFGSVPSEGLHSYRVKKWLDICDVLIRKNGKMPSVLELYQEAIAYLNIENRESTTKTDGRDLQRPNVIFIFIDDQGYYDLGCYGATEVQTPRVDAMARNGVRFTDYYAAAPICSPSRAGLLTGCYPRRTGNEVWVQRPDSKGGIPPSWLTLAELFKGAGYATACIGKWHLGFEEQYLPKNQGFDLYFGILHNLDSFETVYYEDKGGIPLWRDGQVVQRNADPGDLTRLYTEEAIAWIEKQKAAGKPFFLYLPHTMLHTPLGVSPKFKGSSNWGLYGDAIQELDYYTGQLLDALERLEIDDQTFVIYVSDNGRGPGRNAQQPIRGSKLTTYEGGLRVPCIATGPGIRKGFESGVVAHAMDWYPTLASLAGIQILKGLILDGRDLSALLLGKTDAIPEFDQQISLNAEIPLRREFHLDREWGGVFTREEYLNAFFYHGSEGNLAAVRSGKWKLTLNSDLQLYDLDEDPGERFPVKNWNIKTKLRGMVVQFQREMSK
jgi:arylsulfatase A-like enzyme